MLTQTRLKEVFSYSERTGLFTRISKTGCKGVIGAVAKSKINGYVVMGIDGRRYGAHRLVFLYVTGSWPKFDVDHKNGVTDDNRWVNLRDVTHVENMQNLRGPRSDNKSGYLGVTWNEKCQKWRAQIKTGDKKRLHIGMFERPELAHHAYLKAKREHHVGCTI